MCLRSGTDRRAVYPVETARKAVLRNLPDETLMNRLVRDRGHDDCPIRMMGNARVSGGDFQHLAAEALLRGPEPDAQPGPVCGFDMAKGLEAVSDSWSFFRFSARVIALQDVLQQALHSFIDWHAKLLPDYGESLALDSRYELPVGLLRIRTAAREVAEAHRMLDRLGERHPETRERREEGGR